MKFESKFNTGQAVYIPRYKPISDESGKCGECGRDKITTSEFYSCKLTVVQLKMQQFKDGESIFYYDLGMCMFYTDEEIYATLEECQAYCDEENER